MVFVVLHQSFNKAGDKMTVSELSKILENYPGDMEVEFHTFVGLPEPINEAYTCQNDEGEKILMLES
jgi:hypothetical protein